MCSVYKVKIEGIVTVVGVLVPPPPQQMRTLEEM